MPALRSSAASTRQPCRSTAAWQGFAAAAKAMKPVDGARWKANLEAARADYPEHSNT